ncbi:MAG: hypothetical protein WC736_07185 [Gallionella sp.]
MAIQIFQKHITTTGLLHDVRNDKPSGLLRPLQSRNDTHARHRDRERSVAGGDPVFQKHITTTGLLHDVRNDKPSGLLRPLQSRNDTHARHRDRKRSAAGGDPVFQKHITTTGLLQPYRPRNDKLAGLPQPFGLRKPPLLVIATANEVWRVAIQIIKRHITTTGLLRHYVPRKDKPDGLPRPLFFLAKTLDCFPPRIRSQKHVPTDYFVTGTLSVCYQRLRSLPV